MSSGFDLTGRRALVTGGSAGIGLGIATGLASAGASLSIWGRDPGKLERARRELVEIGGQVGTREVDVSDEAAVSAGMTASAEQFGGLDVVVVNAGGMVPSAPFVESTTASYRKLLAANLDGAYWTMREAAKLMVKQSRGDWAGGSIIVVSSLAAHEGAPRNQAYAVSKAGVLAMANACAVELARHRIRVNTILPGWIATDMTAENQASQAFAKRVIPRVPLRRWGTPEDFAGIAVFLASDASAYQTGSAVVVDGGYSLF